MVYNLHTSLEVYQKQTSLDPFLQNRNGFEGLYHSFAMNCLTFAQNVRNKKGGMALNAAAGKPNDCNLIKLICTF